MPVPPPPPEIGEANHCEIPRPGPSGRGRFAFPFVCFVYFVVPQKRWQPSRAGVAKRVQAARERRASSRTEEVAKKIELSVPASGVIERHEHLIGSLAQRQPADTHTPTVVSCGGGRWNSRLKAGASSPGSVTLRSSEAKPGLRSRLEFAGQRSSRSPRIQDTRERQLLGADPQWRVAACKLRIGKRSCHRRYSTSDVPIVHPMPRRSVVARSTHMLVH
jgi:hypothetical protein